MDNFKILKYKLTDILHILLFIFAGIIVLVLLSYIQKIISGYPISLEGFVVPAFFGSISGLVTSLLSIKTKRQNQELKILVKDLQKSIKRAKKIELDLIKKNTEYASLNEKYKTQNDDLILAKKKAEESNELKTAFLNNISHEFRTPMNGILGFTDLLIKPNKTKNQRKQYAKIVKESCGRLLEIITDTIDISEIQNNITSIKENQCSLNEILQEIIEQLKPKIEKKDLKFTFKTNCNDNQLIIKSDKRKLQRSFKHLIDNAIKFTNSGKIELICENDNENISITINDTGIGISQEMQKVIFEPFRQVELDLCRNYGGNGVGLSLVKSYIEILGGTVNLKSEINKGTSVKVTLPLNSTKTTLQEQIAPEKSRLFDLKKTSDS